MSCISVWAHLAWSSSSAAAFVPKLLWTWRAASWRSTAEDFSRIVGWSSEPRRSTLQALGGTLPSRELPQPKHHTIYIVFWLDGVSARGCLSGADEHSTWLGSSCIDTSFHLSFVYRLFKSSISLVRRSKLLLRVGAKQEFWMHGMPGVWYRSCVSP
jgi:hypothetical protein